MLYCPHGSVRSSFESMGEIRFLEIPIQIYLSIYFLSGQSQSLRNLLCGYTSLGNTYFIYFHIHELKSLALTRRWVLAKPVFGCCSSSSSIIINAYGCSACWFCRRSIRAMHIGLLATVYLWTIHQGLGSENLMWRAPEHKGMLGLLHSTSALVTFIYHSAPLLSK